MPLKLSPYTFKRYSHPNKIGWLGWIEKSNEIVYIDLQGKIYHWKAEKLSHKRIFNPSHRW
jgi:hypothetical protein